MINIFSQLRNCVYGFSLSNTSVHNLAAIKINIMYVIYIVLAADTNNVGENAGIIPAINAAISIYPTFPQLIQ